MTSLAPTALLLSIRRGLDHVPAVTLVRDLDWNSDQDRWNLILSVESRKASHHVPKISLWAAVFGLKPETGRCEFYPAKDGGITATFQHQSLNLPGPDAQPWRTGKVCVDDPLSCLGSSFIVPEPVHPVERFLWRVERLVEWVDAAASGSLIMPGDPFELPEYNSDETTLGFCEDRKSYEHWETVDEPFGFVQLGRMEGGNNLLVPIEFEDINGQILYTCSLGSLKSKLRPESRKAFWLRLASVPIKEPWDSRLTWKDLAHLCKASSFNLEHAIGSWIEVLRRAKLHRLLIGFPIPERVGGPSIQYHWLMGYLPGFASQNPKGFRSNSSSLLLCYKKTVLRPNNEIAWGESSNWSSVEVTSRGKLSEDVANAHIVIIGLGAIGSYLAEFLVRSGVQKLYLIDGDEIEAGNVCRHSLSLREVGKNKAEGLEERLATLSADVSVQYSPSTFIGLDQKEKDEVQKCSIVIDATGNDSTLEQLSEFEWVEPKLFVSCSSGVHGHKIYCMANRSLSFPAGDFLTRLLPIVESDWKNIDEKQIPRGHTGCWHPVLPVRVENVAIAASVCVKFVEEAWGLEVNESRLSVFSHKCKDGQFNGIERKDFDITGAILSVVGQ